MKKEILIDAGPIVAAFDRREKAHELVKEKLQYYMGKPITTWPVVTEASHLLSFSHIAQDAMLHWIERGGLTVKDLTQVDLQYIRNRMEKYSDIPMDLADASLMAIAERNNIDSIFSLDSDFIIYKTMKGKKLKNLLN